MRECVIIASMPVPAKLRAAVPEGAFVIAADAGWSRAQEIGLPVNLAVGDFDSATAMPPAHLRVELPAQKDDTDTHYAARIAVQKGYSHVLLLGANGGREDHSFAAYATLLFLAQNGVHNTMLFNAGEVRCLPPGTCEIGRRAHSYLSVFALGGSAKGVTLQGVKYPLQNAVLHPGFPIGVSNEFAAPVARILHSEGYLLVMVTDRDDGKDTL